MPTGNLRQLLQFPGVGYAAYAHYRQQFGPVYTLWMGEVRNNIFGFIHMIPL
jgi:hypothetical protein